MNYKVVMRGAFVTLLTLNNVVEAASPRPHVSAGALPQQTSTTVPVPPTPPDNKTGDLMTIVRTFKLDDLQAALAEAQAQVPPDAVAVTCYAALIPIVQSSIVNQTPSVVGPFLAFQNARNAIANPHSANGPLSTINISCAPLVFNARDTVLQLDAILSSKAEVTDSATIRSPQRRGRRHYHSK